MSVPNRLGRYELLQTLGRGGSGVVYRAVLHGPGGLEKPVALKVLHSGGAGLRREARIGGLLRHPSLVDVFEVGQHDGRWFCAMELCEGGSLSDRGPLPPRAVVEVGLQVAEALAYAHRELNLVHLDLKPANLLVSGERVKVADLGLARARGFDGADQGGTPRYMAPEQAAGVPVDSRADIYALGVTLTELATGHTPGSQTTWSTFAAAEPMPTSTLPAVPWLQPVLDRCLAEDPAARFADMSALADALRQAREDLHGPGLVAHLGLVPQQEPLPVDAWTHLGPDGDAFVGRNDDRRALAELLARPGLITLKGAGGMGKTRLARQVARDWREQTDGRAWFADLSDARSRLGLAQAVANALGIPLGSGDANAVVARVGNAIAGRGNLVLVLDNFEQLVAFAPDIATWQRAAPEARLLVTSRDVLHVDEERVYEVAPLGLRDAITLLEERARDRGVDLHDDPALSQLAERLEGVPLALELAAGRLGVLSPQDVLEMLEPSFLRAASDDLPERQRTLQATLDWSWDLLDDQERRALTQLSVFHGGFTPEAAEAVLDHDGWVLDVLDTLADRSWLVASEGRMGLLESVRTYAYARLEDPGAEVRHGRWFARLGGRAERLSHRAVRQRERTIELDNLVVATRRAVDRGDGRVALACAGGAWNVLRFSGPLAAGPPLVAGLDELDVPVEERPWVCLLLSRTQEKAGSLDKARTWAEAAVAAIRPGSPAHVEVLRHVAHLHLVGGHYDDAMDCLRQAQASDPSDIDQARIHGDFGRAEFQRGRLEEAQQHFQRALPLHRRAGNARGIAQSLGNLANIHHERGELDVARPLREEALTQFRQLGEDIALAYELVNLAVLHHARGRRAQARACYDEAIGIGASTGDLRLVALARFNRGSMQHEAGQVAAALEDMNAALAAYRERASPRWEGVVLWYLTLMHLESGEGPARARAFGERAVEILEGVGDETTAAMARAALGQVALHEGALDEADARLTEASTALEGRNQMELATALALLGETRSQKGDHAGALDLLNRSVRLHDQAQHVRELAVSLLYRARATQRQGRPDDARFDIDRAQSLLDTLEDLLPTAPARRLLQATLSAR